MPGLFVGAITNIGHFVLALESPTDSVINTLRFTPVPLLKIKICEINLFLNSKLTKCKAMGCIDST